MKSASDNNAYPNFCALAAKHEATFSTFRQNPIYQEILEHFTFEDGLHYIEKIENETPMLLNEVSIFRTNDLYGGAETFGYGKYGELSPSTLHYVSQLSYLAQHFGDLSGKDVVEIGGGYGGLAKLVMDKYNIASYTIYDLSETNQLISTYLGKFGEKYLNKLVFGNLDKDLKTQYDICISNCAFTECTPAIQDLYLNRVIKYSSRGFMLYNFRSESYHPVILLSKFENLGLKKLGAKNIDNARSLYFILAWNSQIKLDPLPYKRRYFYKISPLLYYFLLKVFRLLKS